MAFLNGLLGITEPDIPGGDPLTPVLKVTLVPEPGTGLLVGTGLLLLCARRRRLGRRRLLGE